MSVEKVKAYFARFGIEDRVREFEVSTATVELAAQAAGVQLEPLTIGQVYKSAGGYEEKYQHYRALEYRLWK